MLFLRLPAPLRLFGNLTFRRYATTRAGVYHPKVRVLPFKISKEQAILQCGLTAMRYVLRPRNLVEGMLASRKLGERIMYESGEDKAIDPDRIAPAYIPLWMIDAEVEGQPRTGSDKDSRMLMHFVNSCFPGHHYEPLCKVFVDTDSVDAKDVRVFESSLTYHEGEKVNCIPFTVTPLVLPNILRTLPARKSCYKFNDDDKGHVDFRRIFDKITLLAAYPVLLPVYIMKYNRDPEQSNSTDVTIVLSTHVKNGRIFYDTEEPDTEKEGTGTFGWHWLCKPRGPETSFRKPNCSRFANVQGLDMEVGGRLQYWMNSLFDAPNAVASVAQKDIMEMDDPRVRTLDLDDVNKTHAWMTAGERLAIVYNTLELLRAEQIRTYIFTVLLIVRQWERTQELKSERRFESLHREWKKLMNGYSELGKEMHVKKKRLEVWRTTNRPKWMVDWEEGAKGKGSR